jgi:hypothetical protein
MRAGQGRRIARKIEMLTAYLSEQASLRQA